jgi:hypothetical protein
MHQRTGQRNTLFHTAGKPMHRVFCPFTQIDKLKDFIDTLTKVRNVAGSAKETHIFMG